LPASPASAGRPPFIENTLRAIEEARRQGADAVEIDVRACKSGEIVVLHDPDLRRLADDPRHVADLPWSSLKSVDLGGDRAPLLADVADLARSLGLGLNVEIKHDLPDRRAVIAPVAKLLAAYRRSLDSIVSSFDPTTLTLFRAASPEVCVAQLIHESTYHDWAFRLARALRTGGVHVEQTLAVRARCAPFLVDGFVNVWTVNDPSEARRVFELGADAVITDVPGILRASFDSAGPP